jgi:tetratricopeptide (TPR) repeat protein
MSDSLHAEAAAAYAAKDFARAVPLYDRLIAREPGHAEAYYKRGNALRALGQLAAALASYEQAIARRPEFAEAWCNRGVVEQHLARHEAALSSYERAIALAPTDSLAHANRGLLLQELGRWSEALGCFDAALALDPSALQVWFQRGNVLRQLGDFSAALASYEQTLALQADHAAALYNRGVLLERTDRAHEALASYTSAIAAQPEFAEAHYNRAGVLKVLGELEAALESYDRAIAVRADHARAYANRGVVLQELRRFDAALESYDRAIALRPDYAEAWFNRGTLHRQLARWEAALASYERAIAIRPDYAEAHYERAGLLLSHGDYSNGWREYEWRWQCANRAVLGEERSFGVPLWLGRESIAGRRLLVHGEQGLGDTLQFCRFIQRLAVLGAIVIFEVPAPLAALLASLDGVTELVVRGSPLPACDYHCPLMSLPLALGITLDNLPRTVRYLHPDRSRVAAWRNRLGPSEGPRIGLAWSGNPRQNHDRYRSLRLADLIEYLPREFAYFCLQKEVRPEDETTLAANPWIARPDTDFSETAALCDCLDLVISVCTSIAHLSGALGRPTWVLLSFNADWRWLVDRDDSPWYPNVKLYRQSSFGDWRDVLRRVSFDVRSALPMSS